MKKCLQNIRLLWFGNLFKKENRRRFWHSRRREFQIGCSLARKQLIDMKWTSKKRSVRVISQKGIHKKHLQPMHAWKTDVKPDIMVMVMMLTYTININVVTKNILYYSKSWQLRSVLCSLLTNVSNLTMQRCSQDHYRRIITAWRVSKYGPETTLYLDTLNLRIQSEYRKIRTRNNSVFGHFSRSE